MEFFASDPFQASAPNLPEVDVGNQDASGPSFLMHNTPMNATTMAEIFHELVENLPSVFDTFQEPATDETVAAFDDAVPALTVSNMSADSQADVDSSAMQFANNHPSESFQAHLLVSLPLPAH